MRSKRKAISAPGLLLAGAALLVPASASAVTLEDLDARILACNLVLKSLLAMPDRGIPTDLLRRCRGVAVFPGVLKVGAVLDVSFGNGVILRRDEKTGQWSKPAFFRIRGGSFGLQAGAQSTDLILLFMSERSVECLLEEKFTLGADVSVAAGPVGREVSAETDMKFDAGILSYSRARGLFAGLSLKAATLVADLEANEAYHGQEITVQDVFYESKGALSDNGRLLLSTLEQAAK
jgi:lipid-binding SYLF domain-containing protein